MRGSTGLAAAASAIALMLSAAAPISAVEGYLSGGEHTVALPEIQSGFVTVLDQFPEGSPTIGTIPAEGLLLLASGQTVYLQTNHGAGSFVVVGTTSTVMDPAFIAIEPGGANVAIGMGFGQPLLIVPTSLLDPASPPQLDTSGAVTALSRFYQDGTWIQPGQLALTGGVWPGPVSVAGIGVVFTNQPGAPGAALVTDIPGASGGLTVDGAGNFYTGLGYAPGGGGADNRTGEIRVFPASAIAGAIQAGGSLAYASGVLLAENVLSASTLQSDRRTPGAVGDLFVGGGDAFGAGGAAELGYGAVISAEAIAAALTGLGPVSESSADYVELAPDPCEDDSSITAVFGNFAGGVGFMWNPTTLGQCGPAATDDWGPGVTPNLTVYFDGSEDDSDGDGVPDSADNAYLTPNPLQQDGDGDGNGDIADADFNNDGYVGFDDFLLMRLVFGGPPGPGNSQYDMDGDGTVGFTDFFQLRTRYQTFGPWF